MSYIDLKSLLYKPFFISENERKSSRGNKKDIRLYIEYIEVCVY